MTPLLVTGTIVGGERTSAQLRATGYRVSTYAPKVASAFATGLRDTVRFHASGRPGPRVITGEYWESIRGRRVKIPDGWAAEAYSDAPQSSRLEYGFVGVDSLGRDYNQPPYPHFAPAIADAEEPFYAAVARLVVV